MSGFFTINNKIARDSSKKKEPKYPNWRYDDDNLCEDCANLLTCENDK